MNTSGFTTILGNLAADICKSHLRTYFFLSFFLSGLCRWFAICHAPCFGWRWGPCSGHYLHGESVSLCDTVSQLWIKYWTPRLILWRNCGCSLVILTTFIFIAVFSARVFVRRFLKLIVELSVPVRAFTAPSFCFFQSQSVIVERGGGICMCRLTNCINCQH